MKPNVSTKLKSFTPPPAADDWQWDSVRRIVFKSGGEAIRHCLLIKPEHVGIWTLTMGAIKQHDVGRELIVDVRKNQLIGAAPIADYIQDPKPRMPEDEQRDRIVAHVRRAIAKYKAVLEEMGVPS